MGIGTDNLIKIKTDQNGKMCTADLESKIIASKEEGKYPFFVNATAGTTVLGAIDPLNEIADVCQKHNIWFHVDVCSNVNQICELLIVITCRHATQEL